MTIPAINQFLERILQAFEEGDPLVGHKERERNNVRIVQRMYEAIARGDFDAALNEMTEDIEMEILGPPGAPMVCACRGRSAVRDALIHNFSLVDDQRPEILTVTAQGDTVVIVAQETGLFKPTGKRYNLHLVQIFTFRGDKTVHFREIADVATLIHPLPTPAP